MKIDYHPKALEQLEDAPANIRKAFFKQVKFLEHNLNHPSLHAKKYGGADDLWQARITKAWRFFFKIVDDTYVIAGIIPHPKK